MTDDDKALVERLREYPCEYCDSDTITAADRIEQLTAKNERLQAALTQIARLRTDLRGDFSLGSYQSDIARAALGETE